MQKVETKVVMYADDIVCFWEDPFVSIAELRKVIDAFDQLSRYKVNKNKSNFMRFQYFTTIESKYLERNSC